MNLKQILTSMSSEEISKIKENAIPIETYGGQTLDEIVFMLEKLRRQNKLNYYADVNGVRLYSIDVTIQSAYKEYFGCSKKTIIKRTKKEAERCRKNSEQLKEIAINNLEKWIKEGMEFIHPEKYDAWKNKCKASVYGDYNGLEVEKTLEIMRWLKEKIPFEDIKYRIYHDGHSGMSYSRTMDTVLLFASEGPDLYRFMNSNDMSNIDKKYVKKVELMNKWLNQGKNLNDVLEKLKSHRIMDLSITSDSKLDCYEGTILVDKNNFFEGYLSDKLVVGKLYDNYMSFMAFSYEEWPIHYFGNEKGMYEIYSSLDGVLPRLEVSISVKDSQKDFIDEIYIEDGIRKAKKSLIKSERKIYNEFVEELKEEYKEQENGYVKILVNKRD